MKIKIFGTPEVFNKIITGYPGEGNPFEITYQVNKTLQFNAKIYDGWEFEELPNMLQCLSDNLKKSEVEVEEIYITDIKHVELDFPLL